MILKALKKDYFISTKKKTVVCKIKWALVAPNRKPLIIDGKDGKAKVYRDAFMFVTSGKAVCMPMDTMDVVLGQHLAEKRAMIKGYRRASKTCYRIERYLSTVAKEESDDSDKYMSMMNLTMEDETDMLMKL